MHLIIGLITLSDYIMSKYACVSASALLSF